MPGDPGKRIGSSVRCTTCVHVDGLGTANGGEHLSGPPTRVGFQVRGAYRDTEVTEGR